MLVILGVGGVDRCIVGLLVIVSVAVPVDAIVLMPASRVRLRPN